MVQERESSLKNRELSRVLLQNLLLSRISLASSAILH